MLVIRFVISKNRYCNPEILRRTLKNTIVALCTLGLCTAAGAAETLTMDVNGADLRYVSKGTGTPVVFVHGGVSDARVWDPYSDTISREARFVAYSQRYFGLSPWPDDGSAFQRETHISDLVSFIEGLGTTPIHLVTWSYGGEIGANAVLRRPDLFRSVIHYEPVIGSILAGMPGAANATRTLFDTFGPAVKAATHGNGESAALRFIEAVFELPMGGAEKEPAEVVAMWRENGRTVLPQISMVPPKPLSCKDFQLSTVPTLVVQGENSYTRYAMMADRISECLANAMQLTMKNVNHDGPFREPEMFADLIKVFIQLNERLVE